MWLVWIIALALIGAGLYLWRHRLDNVPPAPPYESSGGATDGSDEDGKPQGPEQAE